jgi:hypothetical protein
MAARRANRFDRAGQNPPAQSDNSHVGLALEVPFGERELPDSPAAAGTTSDTSIISTTFNHPFYVVGKGWVSAASVEIGDELRTPDGSTEVVADLFASGDVEPVFNLCVEGAHTYFVAGDDTGSFVLVHNDSAGPNFDAVMQTVEKLAPDVAAFMKYADVRLSLRDPGFFNNFFVKNFDVVASKDANGKYYDAFKVSASASNYDVYKWLTGSVRGSKAYQDWAKKDGWVEDPRAHSAVTPEVGSSAYYEGQRWAWEARVVEMKQAGATDAEISAVRRAWWGNAIAGPGGVAETIVMAAAPWAGKAAVENGGGRTTAMGRPVRRVGSRSGLPITPQVEPLTAEELATIENMKQKAPSSYADGQAGYTDSLGFPVRHPNVADAHLAKQAAEANRLIQENGLTSDNAVILYNKPLKPANNPFASGNRATKPDVQVFKKTPNGWDRIGNPIEIEPTGASFSGKQVLYKENGGGSFTAVEY